MAKTKNTTSTITLKMYVDLLRRASQGGIGYIDELLLSERRAAKELLNSGLLSDGGSRIVASTAVITPEGASALEAWSSYLRLESKWHKIGEVLIRFFWILVGALVASVSDIAHRLFG